MFEITLVNKLSAKAAGLSDFVNTGPSKHIILSLTNKIIKAETIRPLQRNTIFLSRTTARNPFLRLIAIKTS